MPQTLNNCSNHYKRLTLAGPQSRPWCLRRPKQKYFQGPFYPSFERQATQGLPGALRRSSICLVTGLALRLVAPGARATFNDTHKLFADPFSAFPPSFSLFLLPHSHQPAPSAAFSSSRAAWAPPGGSFQRFSITAASSTVLVHPQALGEGGEEKVSGTLEKHTTVQFLGTFPTLLIWGRNYHYPRRSRRLKNKIVISF